MPPVFEQSLFLFTTGPLREASCRPYPQSRLLLFLLRLSPLPIRGIPSNTRAAAGGQSQNYYLCHFSRRCFCFQVHQANIDSFQGVLNRISRVKVAGRYNDFETPKVCSLCGSNLALFFKWSVFCSHDGGHRRQCKGHRECTEGKRVFFYIEYLKNARLDTNFLSPLRIFDDTVLVFISDNGGNPDNNGGNNFPLRYFKKKDFENAIFFCLGAGSIPLGKEESGSQPSFIPRSWEKTWGDKSTNGKARIRKKSC